MEIVQPGDVLLYPVDVTVDGGEAKRDLAAVMPGVHVEIFYGGRAAVVYRPREAQRPEPDIEAAAKRAFAAIHANDGYTWEGAHFPSREDFRRIARAMLEVGE